MKKSEKHDPTPVLVMTAVPDRSTGQKISRAILEERLAACVTISGACESSYWWEEKIAQDQEFILFIKTKSSLFDRLEGKIKELHPYEVPEIIALPVVKGHKAYLAWLEKETKA